MDDFTSPFGVIVRRKRGRRTGPAPRTGLGPGEIAGGLARSWTKESVVHRWAFLVPRQGTLRDAGPRRLTLTVDFGCAAAWVSIWLAPGGSAAHLTEEFVVRGPPGDHLLLIQAARRADPPVRVSGSARAAYYARVPVDSIGRFSIGEVPVEFWRIDVVVDRRVDLSICDYRSAPCSRCAWLVMRCR